MTSPKKTVVSGEDLKTLARILGVSVPKSGKMSITMEDSSAKQFASLQQGQADDEVTLLAHRSVLACW